MRFGWRPGSTDAVYDATAGAGANEAASADLALAELGRAGVRSGLAEETARLIRLTAGHQVAPDDASGAVLVDADLAILAAAPDAYDCYTVEVRAEYGHLDDDAWRTGRRAVLSGFLSGPALFRIGDDCGPRDARARANMRRELRTLGD